MSNVRVLWVGENVLGFDFDNEVFNSDWTFVNGNAGQVVMVVSVMQVSAPT